MKYFLFVLSFLLLGSSQSQIDRTGPVRPVFAPYDVSIGIDSSVTLGTCSGGGSASVVANSSSATVYQTQQGTWRFRTNLYFQVSSATRTSCVVNFTNLDCAASQIFYGSSQSASAGQTSQTVDTSDTDNVCAFQINHASSAQDTYWMFADVILKRKPGFIHERP